MGRLRGPAWPTLVPVDPCGYVVAQATGEGHGPQFSALVDELVAAYGEALRRGALFASGEGQESHLPDARGHEGGFPVVPEPRRCRRAACDGEGVFAASHLYRQEWTVEVRATEEAPAEITLDLDG